MTRFQQVIQLIYNAIDELSEQLDEGLNLEKSPDTVLFGKSGNLDSNGLVNLIVIVEEKIEDEFGVMVTIADEKAMSRKQSPFLNVKALADYVQILLDENHA